MAYTARGFRTLDNLGAASSSGPGNTTRLHSYVTNDLLATVAGAGYFNAAAGFINTGDLILVAADIDGTPATNCYVATNTDNVITTVGFATVTQTFAERLALTTLVDLTDGDSGHVVAPIAGTIERIDTVLLGVITTNDAVCTWKIGSTAVTGGAITIANSGAAIGDVDTASAITAAKTVAAGDVVKCTVSGTPGGSKQARVTIHIVPS